MGSPQRVTQPGTGVTDLLAAPSEAWPAPKGAVLFRAPLVRSQDQSSATIRLGGRSAGGLNTPGLTLIGKDQPPSTGPGPAARDPATAGVVTIPVSLVAIAAWDAASFVLQHGLVPSLNQTCPAATPLQIVLPGGGGIVLANTTIEPRGGDVDVSPVQTGTAAPA